jgi:hypothetical protein
MQELKPADSISANSSSVAPIGLTPVAVRVTRSPRRRISRHSARGRRLDRHVEGRVDQLESVRAGDARHVLDLVDDLGGGSQAMHAPLEARV